MGRILRSSALVGTLEKCDLASCVHVVSLSISLGVRRGVLYIFDLPAVAVSTGKAGTTLEAFCRGGFGGVGF